MILVHQQDPNRIPISPPKPTPYLYRTGKFHKSLFHAIYELLLQFYTFLAFLKQQRRQESPALGREYSNQIFCQFNKFFLLLAVGTIGVPSSLNLPCAPIFPPYIPNTGGARLGPRNQGPYEYRDLDAPKPIATAVRIESNYLSIFYCLFLTEWKPSCGNSI